MKWLTKFAPFSVFLILNASVALASEPPKNFSDLCESYLQEQTRALADGALHPYLPELLTSIKDLHVELANITGYLFQMGWTFSNQESDSPKLVLDRPLSASTSLGFMIRSHGNFGSVFLARQLSPFQVVVRSSLGRDPIVILSRRFDLNNEHSQQRLALEAVNVATAFAVLPGVHILELEFPLGEQESADLDPRELPVVKTLENLLGLEFVRIRLQSRPSRSVHVYLKVPNFKPWEAQLESELQFEPAPSSGPASGPSKPATVSWINKVRQRLIK